jgi:hypothetical protein
VEHHSQSQRQRLIQQNSYSRQFWTPSGAVAIAWNVLGAVLAVVSLVPFLVLYGVTADQSESIEISFNILAVLAGAISVLILHEVIHGLIARWYGGRPKFGAVLLNKFLPAFYCTVPGHLFTKREFIIFALAPLVLISVAGSLILMLTSVGAWLILALAFNVGGAIGDLWMTGLVIRQPSGTLIEDERYGITIHRPEWS